MSKESGKTGKASPGWILVTALLLLCITGTGLTWWNYSRQVFTTHGLIRVSGPEILVVVNDLPYRYVQKIRRGHQAKITIGQDKHLLHGTVFDIQPGTLSLLIRLKEGELPSPKRLNDGTLCFVTIDTTVPPLAD